VAALQRIHRLITSAIVGSDAINTDLERATELRNSATTLLDAYDKLVRVSYVATLQGATRIPDTVVMNVRTALKMALSVAHPETLHARWQGMLQTCVTSIVGKPITATKPPMDIPRTMLKVVNWATTMAEEIYAPSVLTAPTHRENGRTVQPWAKVHPPSASRPPLSS